jgi:predicted metal-binding membrane protein
LERLTLRSRATIVALLLGAALVAWIVTVQRMRGMDAGPGTDLGTLGWYLGIWVTMMAAMMLPSAAPLVLLYRGTGQDGRALNAVPLVAAYLLVWAAFGALVYTAQQGLGAVTNASPALGNARPYAVAGILAIAGLYQFTFLKRACLRKCRSPIDFLMHHWRGRGAFDALRLGAEHGAYCVGCCWGLMAVLVISGAMSLLWVVLIALIVFVEKVMPFGERSAQLSGAGLWLLAVLVAVHPQMSMLLRGGGSGM